MQTVTVSYKGQVVIPVEIRRRLGINPGCQLDFRLDGLVTVSYTHLDVYKRQDIISPWGTGGSSNSMMLVMSRIFFSSSVG